MSKQVTSTLCIGLVLLGLAISICFGAEDILPPLMDVRDMRDTSDNKQSLNLMQAIRQYSSKLNDRNPPVDEDAADDDDAGKRKTRSMAMMQDATKSFPIRERLTDEDSTGDYTEYAAGKRAMNLQKNPLDMGFKNRPGFRSWGGKRSKFVTWGGKRLAPEIVRIHRSKFNNWGGKRSVVADDDFEVFDEEKRDTFRSWGGKRAVLVPPTHRTAYDSHSKFSNWGGKRFDSDDCKGGKRDLEYMIPYEQEGASQYEVKRGQFQSWGGKRLDRLNDGYVPDETAGINWLLRRYVTSLLNTIENDRRIGKKNMFNSGGSGDYGDISTSAFSAWRGRR